MAAYLSSPMKMKRKDLDQVNEDFSDFSLSSPARKIRRLDADLPPIMEEDVEPPSPEKQVAVNEERAIVLFMTPIVQSPPFFSINLDSDALSAYKSKSSSGRFLRPSGTEDSEVERNGDCRGASDQCRAVVPWVPSRFGRTLHSKGYHMEILELMEPEETGTTAMDIEDDNDIMAQGGSLYFDGELRESESIQQWQQQHSITPQISRKRFTPIAWYR